MDTDLTEPLGRINLNDDDGLCDLYGCDYERHPGAVVHGRVIDDFGVPTEIELRVCRRHLMQLSASTLNGVSVA